MKAMTGTLKRNRRIVSASIIAALFALITFAGFSLVNPVAASAETAYGYVALGDSITTGYGLTDPDTEGFAAQLETSWNKTALNAGINGQTSDELLISAADADTAATLQTADVVTITIGGNDLMAVFYGFIAEVVTSGSYTASEVEAALTNPASYLIKALTILNALTGTDWSSELSSYSAFVTAVDATVTNINTLTSAIKTYNADAVILVANQYNPYQWLDSNYQNIINLFETGVTAYNSYLSTYANGAYNIVDVYSVFAASSATLTNVNASSYDFDFHPNAAGHAAIATEMAEAYKEATKSAIRLGADTITTGNTLYLGTYNSYNVPWIVLDDDGTLLSEYILDDSEYYTYTNFNSLSGAIYYDGSDLEVKMAQLYSIILTSVEANQINITQITDNGTLLAEFYALSSDEASALSDDVRIAYYIDNTSTAGEWWTRTIESVGTSADMSFAYTIIASGTISLPLMSSFSGVRPATSLNTANVLFTSAAADGKEASGMNGGLTAVKTYNGTDWKATIYDDSRAGFTASRTIKDGNVITINYSGATTGTDEYISAIVVDDSGKVTRYGRLLQLDGTTNADSGTFTVDISSLSGSDTLYIINEQYNGSYKTDYSSALKAIDTSKSTAELTAEIEQLEAELLANQQATITSANSTLAASLVNFAAIVNDSSSTTAELTAGLITLLTDYNSAYAALAQITAQNPTDATLLAGMATLEATLTTAESAITTAINTLQTNLDSAVSDLNAAIAAGDDDLSDEIAAVEEAYKAAIENLQQQLADTKAELEALINETQDSASTQRTISIAMYSVLGALSLGGIGMSAGLWISMRKRR